MREFQLRIYRTWRWQIAVPTSEVRFGGRNPMELVAHDELQFGFVNDSDPFDPFINWEPVQIVEAEKPENPHDKEDREESERMTAELMKIIPPVDRAQSTLTDGSPVPKDYSHTQDRGDGQQKGYVILSAEERAKGFVRPVRQSYIHKPCGVVTHMGLALAETYARDPGFYNGTFCCGCHKHFPLDQFVWNGTDEQVGN